MQRLMKDERGAVAVVIAIVMVVLLGMAAIAIDVTASWARQHQLQNGADAGALAIAQNCARNACGSPIGTAQTYVTANSYDNTAVASVDGPTAGVVTVYATDPSYEHWFAPVLDPKFSSSVIGAEATAKWGWPTGGATLPLTFSKCEFDKQVSLDSTTPGTIYFPKKAPDSTTGCGKGPSGNWVPGGFAWVDTDGTCTQNSSIMGSGTWLDSDTGNTPSAGCNPPDFAKMLDHVILIPLFNDAVKDSKGDNYHVIGYAAFKLVGYNFGGSYKVGTACNGPDRCVEGYFTRYVDLNEVLEFGPGGGNFGAAIVTLTK